MGGGTEKGMRGGVLLIHWNAGESGRWPKCEAMLTTSKGMNTRKPHAVASPIPTQMLKNVSIRLSASRLYHAPFRAFCNPDKLLIRPLAARRAGLGFRGRFLLLNHASPAAR